MTYELIHHEGRDEINNNLSWSHHPGCDPALPGCWCSGRGKVSIGICAAVVSCYYSVVTGGRGVIVQPLLCQEWLHGERAPGSMGTLGTMTPAAAFILLLTLSSTSAQNTSREDLLDISTLLKNFQVAIWKNPVCTTFTSLDGPGWLWQESSAKLWRHPCVCQGDGDSQDAWRMRCVMDLTSRCRCMFSPWKTSTSSSWTTHLTCTSGKSTHSPRTNNIFKIPIFSSQ